MPKIVACLGWKYEPEWMIEDFKKNMDWVDDFAILDCRHRDELWIHEGEYRRILRQMAKDRGAEWILISSADERYEKEAGKIIRAEMEADYGNAWQAPRIIYEFNLREMYSPTEYRVNGIWNKRRRRLYPYYSDQTMAYQPIQCPSIPQEPIYKIKYLNINIYHLKMIEPQNRKLRVEVFKKLDPTNKYQGEGYDYLDDEDKIHLNGIPEGREYYPPYRKYIFKVPKKYL